MQPLLDYLKTKNNLTTEQLEAKLLNEPEKLQAQLEGLPLYTGHGPRRDPLIFDRISCRVLGEIQVNGGGVSGSIQQFLYNKYGIALKHPRYPCLVQQSGYFGLDLYYPLELVLIDKK